ncbi:hypothetical protein [Salinibius halmophilus]|uniref:hypothetical protein n=1 Tax=Salinibius halmophilus TaxID=1853216 RepID=UPI000E66DEC5|nr:hypothetical protein [Salinibius halmophilus]
MQPDIEIYLKATSHEQVIEWLEQKFGNVGDNPWAKLPKKGFGACVTWEGEPIKVMIIEKCAGNFTSVWFDSAHTPWQNDLACAREAVAFLQVEARVGAGGWHEGAELDAWIALRDGEEVEIEWLSA